MSSEPRPFPEMFEVESILQRGHSEGQRYYLVKWKGYSEAEATWEPESNLAGCRAAIEEFEKAIKLLDAQKEKPRQLRKSGNGNGNENEKKRGRKKRRNGVLADDAGLQTRKMTNTFSRSKDFSGDSKNYGDPIKKVHEEVSSKELESSLESFLESSEFSELEATTAQTAPFLRETDQILGKEYSSKCQQTNSNKIFKEKVEYEEPLKLEHNKMMNFQSQIKAAQSQKASQKTSQISEIEKNEKIGLSSERSEKKMEKKIQKAAEKTIQLKVNSQFSECLVSKSENSQTNTQNKKTKGLDIHSAYSHRQELCQQELLELKIEILNSGLKSRKNTKHQKKVEKIGQKSRKYLGCFIDLSTSECSSMNKEIFEKVLTKSQTLRLDEEGEFLYSRIECLIRGVEAKAKNGSFSRTWICALKDRKKDERDDEENDEWKHLVRVDDLREDLWKKLFRKFTMMKDQ